MSHKCAYITTRIIDARIACRRDLSPTYAVFAFDEFGPKRRAQITADITAIYEACLIDIGRNWPQWDFMYPKAEVIAQKRTRTRKSG
jgi:hypothetical protein